VNREITGSVYDPDLLSNVTETLEDFPSEYEWGTHTVKYLKGSYVDIEGRRRTHSVEIPIPAKSYKLIRASNTVFKRMEHLVILGDNNAFIECDHFTSFGDHFNALKCGDHRVLIGDHSVVFDSQNVAVNCNIM
jgi:hypothetical protein